MANKKIIHGRAPLRISFAGGGTDLNEVFEKYGGNIISSTINKFVHIIVEEGKGLTINGEKPDIFSERLLKRLKAKNMKISTWYEIPHSRGLGSSSTYSVLLAKAVSKFQGKEMRDKETVELVYGVESELGKCGWQDQYAAVKGGFNWMEFYFDKTVYPLRIDWQTIYNLENSLCLIYTGLTHNSGDVQSNKKELTAEMAETLKDLARKVRDCLLMKNIEEIGNLLSKGWEIKKATGVSNENADRLYAKGLKLGAIGGKLSGAGHGGYILFFVPPHKMFKFRQEMSKEYEILDFKFTLSGVELW